MVSEQRPELPNRQTPFSEAFKQFICTDWAPYDQTMPAPLAGATAAAAHRARLSTIYPGQRLIVPAGGLKARSTRTSGSQSASGSMSPKQPSGSGGSGSPSGRPEST